MWLYTEATTYICCGSLLCGRHVAFPSVPGLSSLLWPRLHFVLLLYYVCIFLCMPLAWPRCCLCRLCWCPRRPRVVPTQLKRTHKRALAQSKAHRTLQKTHLSHLTTRTGDIFQLFALVFFYWSVANESARASVSVS